MIDRLTFNEVVKDCLGNLYDFTALETHPLIFSILKPPTGYAGTRDEFVRGLVLEAIELLKPPRIESTPSSPEWRPYLILRKRFVEGMGLQELADFLSISGRQLRRDQARSLQAVAAVLWEKLYRGQEENAPGEIIADNVSDQEVQPGSEYQAFEVHDEVVDIRETTLRVFDMLKQRMDDKGVVVEFAFAEPSVPVITDRIILRQILISMFNAALHMQAEKKIVVSSRVEDGQVGIRLAVKAGDDWELAGEDEEESALDSVSYWGKLIRADLDERVEIKEGINWAVREILLPRSDQRVVMVVDDQEPAINLFRRYLSQTNIITIGASRADQVVPLACHFQPVLITLDVMMPQMDGWELLQQLKTNVETRHIPVIVCSAWEDPDLSRSLGADKFLKKPVTQKMLLAAMEELIPPARRGKK
ncbi:MAG: response regulator [Anaerolineaceae bacterium]